MKDKMTRNLSTSISTPSRPVLPSPKAVSLQTPSTPRTPREVASTSISSVPKAVRSVSRSANKAEKNKGVMVQGNVDGQAIEEHMEKGNDGGDEVLDELLSPRERRHLKLVAIRAEQEKVDQHFTEDDVCGDKGGVVEIELGHNGVEDEDEDDEDEDEDDEDEDDGDGDEDDQEDVEDDSEEVSEDDSDEESDKDDEDEDSDEEEANLERLLQAARVTALKSENKSSSIIINTKSIDSEELELKFDEERGSKRAPIPDLSIPDLPTQHLAYGPDGSAKAHTSLVSVNAEAGPSRPRVKNGGKSAQVKEGKVSPELDTRPYEKELSKRQKAAQPKKASVSEMWATLPSARADALPQMKRDYQALVLANSLDPKRFMKGGNKIGKVPERFAIGTMIETSRRLQDSTIGKDSKYRAGQVVDGLIKEKEVGNYAKRKFEELQNSRMRNGRGQGWKKRSKW